MTFSTRLLWIVSVAAFVLGGLAITEVVRLDHRLQRTVMSDMVVVPTRFDVTRSNAGIGPSANGQDMVLWLGRMDSNAQTRLVVDKDGGQTLGFFDKRGKLRLSIGIDAAGQPHIRFVDANGTERSVNPSAL